MIPGETVHHEIRAAAVGDGPPVGAGQLAGGTAITCPGMARVGRYPLTAWRDGLRQ
jgi:hypothetical protein